MRRTKQVYSIDDRKIRLEQKLLFFPLFRLNTILVKNLETLVSCVPFPMLIWVSQWSQCFKTPVAQHWGGRRHISGGKTVWSRNLRIFPENSRETVSVSTICDEYCRSSPVVILTTNDGSQMFCAHYSVTSFLKMEFRITLLKTIIFPSGQCQRTQQKFLRTFQLLSGLCS